MLLFASENTQINLHAFIENPAPRNLKASALAMRVDLGRSSIEDRINKLQFEPNSQTNDRT